MNIVFNHVSAEAAGISSFHFTADKPVKYDPGQFVELSLPLQGRDAPYTMRQFTLSSAPTENHLTVTTWHDDAASPFKQALLALRPGDSINMSEPIGDFVLPIDARRPLIFVAGGIGITPFRSMLTWLHDRGEQRPIKLLYAVRREADIIFLSDLKQAGQHATIVVTEPTSSWGGQRGRLTADTIIGVEQPDSDSLIYLSGPETMVSGLAADLQGRGIRHDQLISDLFLGYATI